MCSGREVVVEEELARPQRPVQVCVGSDLLAGPAVCSPGRSSLGPWNEPRGAQSGWLQSICVTGSPLP